MANILIVGYGEIGRSIANIYYDINQNRLKEDNDNLYEIFALDINGPIEGLEPFLDVDIMHICIPYTDESEFKAKVLEYFSQYRPRLTIIHSTIPMGTTRRIWEKNPTINIAHSPVMGKHPNLKESILGFIKIIGSPDIEVANAVKKHFKELGIKGSIYNNSEESELAKLLDTTYYGICIVYMQEIYKYCKENSLDYENVYKLTNHIYNQGYKDLGIDSIKRPALTFQGEGIGGHCVVENAQILEKQSILTDFARLITKIGKPKK